MKEIVEYINFVVWEIEDESVGTIATQYNLKIIIFANMQYNHPTCVVQS